jgi:hypothetical protein
MRRRNFVTLLGSTMVMRSLTAHAQQSGGMRRIGVLMSHPETDSDTLRPPRYAREEKPKDGRRARRHTRRCQKVNVPLRSIAAEFSYVPVSLMPRVSAAQGKRCPRLDRQSR